MGSQVGHLPAKLMIKLAPYIDGGLISLEGIIIGEKGVCTALVASLVLSGTDFYLSLLRPFKHFPKVLVR